MVGVLMAFVASVVVGASDFLGGLASRRWSVVQVSTWTYGTATAVTAVVVAVTGGMWSARTGVAGTIAGVLFVVGFLAFYASLTLGRMGVTASIVAAIQALVPVVVAITWGGERLSPVAIGGALLAISGAVILSGADDQDTASSSRWPIVLAVIAGSCFGSAVVALNAAPEEAGFIVVLVEIAVGFILLLGLLAVARQSNGLAGLLARMGLDTPGRPAAERLAGKRIAVAAGILLSLSTVALVAALQIGPLAPVAVVSATYPVTTTVLALVVLHEHLRARHIIGIAAALVGCALLGLR